MVICLHEHELLPQAVTASKDDDQTVVTAATHHVGAVQAGAEDRGVEVEVPGVRHLGGEESVRLSHHCPRCLRLAAH